MCVAPQQTQRAIHIKIVAIMFLVKVVHASAGVVSLSRFSAHAEMAFQKCVTSCNLDGSSIEYSSQSNVDEQTLNTAHERSDLTEHYSLNEVGYGVYEVEFQGLKQSCLRDADCQHWTKDGHWDGSRTEYRPERLADDWV